MAQGVVYDNPICFASRWCNSAPLRTPLCKASNVLINGMNFMQFHCSLVSRFKLGRVYMSELLSALSSWLLLLSTFYLIHTLNVYADVIHAFSELLPVRPLFHLIFAPIWSLFPIRFMLNLSDLGSNYLPSIHFVPELRLSSFQEKSSGFDGKEDFKSKFKED